MMPNPSILRQLRWFSDEQHVEQPNRDVAVTFRHAAEALVESAHETSPELLRALELLVTAHDAAQRVATLCHEDKVREDMKHLVEEPERAGTIATAPSNNASRRLS